MICEELRQHAVRLEGQLTSWRDDYDSSTCKKQVIEKCRYMYMCDFWFKAHFVRGLSYSKVIDKLGGTKGRVLANRGAHCHKVRGWDTQYPSKWHNESAGTYMQY